MSIAPTYEYIVPIGDWDGSGHGKSLHCSITTNKPKSDILEAYHKTEQLLNMTLNSYEYGSYDTVLLKDNNLIPRDIMDILVEHGIYVSDITDDDEDSDTYAVTPYQAAILFMEFAKISLPDLHYTFHENSDLYLFGRYIGYPEPGQLSAMVGYGCLND